MKERVIAVLSEFTDVPVDEITGDSRLVGDLGFSSLDFVGVLARLEEEFDLNVDECEIVDFQTVDNVVAILTQSVGQDDRPSDPELG